MGRLKRLHVPRNDGCCRGDPHNFLACLRKLLRTNNLVCIDRCCCAQNLEGEELAGKILQNKDLVQGGVPLIFFTALLRSLTANDLGERDSHSFGKNPEPQDLRARSCGIRNCTVARTLRDSLPRLLGRWQWLRAWHQFALSIASVKVVRHTLRENAAAHLWKTDGGFCRVASRKKSNFH